MPNEIAVKPQGCDVKSLDSIAEGLLNWACGGECPTDVAAADFQWLLAYCDDGIVWGEQRAGKWALPGKAFREISPELKRESLIELRIFGKKSEILIWRNHNDTLNGRILSGNGNAASLDKSLSSMEETFIVLGDRVVETFKDGFTVIGSSNGARHAVPFELKDTDFGTKDNSKWPLRLGVTHYFAQDDKTGCVRIAASRLRSLEQEK